MAGGTGTRFWPLSTKSKPKQFLDILGTGRSLLQMTFDRFKKICPVENIFIVTNERYNKVIKEQLPELSDNQILLEPAKKNTAPCIAYANYKIQGINPEANIVVSPADHLILDETKFIKNIEEGLLFTSKNDALLTLGIQPTRAETGYGYIQINEEKEVKDNKNIYKVKTFTEKPDKDLAQKFYESGEFFWNSGIFIWSLKSIQAAFKKYLSDVDELFAEGVDKFNTEEEHDFISKVYFNCKSISIDYGIMEKADKVFVYVSKFGWADLGTWSSLQEHLDNDKNNNTIHGKNVLTYDVKNSFINFKDEKLVVIKGLDNYIIVESDDKLLIYKKEDEQEIKEIVNKLENEKGSEYV
jgi:mannose-1-phosphate guanylyltransferase